MMTKYFTKWRSLREGGEEIDKQDIYSYSTVLNAQMEDDFYIEASELLIDRIDYKRFEVEEAEAIIKEYAPDKLIQVDSDMIGIRDDLIGNITRSMHKNELAKEIYDELMPKSVSPLIEKFTSFPIQLIAEGNKEGVTEISYVEVDLYIYADGRCILRFSHDFNLDDVSEKFSIDKTVSFARMPKVVLYKKYKKIEVNNYERIEADSARVAINQYVNHIIDFIGIRPSINEHYEQINILNINHKDIDLGKESLTFKKIIYGLSHSPISEQRLETLDKVELNKNNINLLGIAGVVLNKYKLVTWPNQFFKNEIFKGAENSDINKELFYYVNLSENIWPMLESNLLKSLRLKAALYMYKQRLPSEREIQKELTSSYIGNRAENAVLFSKMATVEEFTGEFEVNIISKERKSRMNELIDQQSKIYNFTHNRIKNQMSFIITIIGVILTVILSYDAIDKIVAAYGSEKLTGPIYFSFLTFFSLLLICVILYQRKKS
ncbi:hypothetical protein [Listeria booriae]|uniref:Uncharacterized protein n=1 Tax=Listeria booriae TaxID=1552123 RepID=A0A7X0XK27_9LIST|nr:hypothetical protein [Listeria booriae]MBC1562457.1 hypothetical protein [Listeria booriae]